MLQQTQVKTVIPYWERWMREFPTIQSLSNAAEERVLKLWEGLGYYSRARNLHKAARQIGSASFPTEFEAILELPGIGRYTAGAIASIAFGQQKPIVDGNVARVLSRFFGLTDDCWKASTKLVESTDSPSDLNQGMMELGATICLPRKPLCRGCPLHSRCYAFTEDKIAKFPPPKRRAVTATRVFRAELHRLGDSILLRQRPPGVVNASFWELPNEEVFENSTSQPLCIIKHSITRYRMSLELHPARRPAKGSGKWFKASDLTGLPIVSAHRKALARIGLVAQSNA